MTNETEAANYAWVITRDHLYEARETGESPFDNEVGQSGPWDAPDILLDVLKKDKTVESGKTYKFHIYDDDGILYYTGRIATFEANPSEETLMAPLYDFGGPGAGATLIKYDGHPEWTIEY